MPPMREEKDLKMKQCGKWNFRKLLKIKQCGKWNFSKIEPSGKRNLFKNWNNVESEISYHVKFYLSKKFKNIPKRNLRNCA